MKGIVFLVSTTLMKPSIEYLTWFFSNITRRRKCEELNKDIVMTNINARPPICKAYDYKDDLYKKFLKEVIEKDLPKCLYLELSCY